MKRWILAAVRQVALLTVLLLPPAFALAAVIFSDDFDSGPSPFWGNESGAWTAVSGTYFATAPNNAPNAYSSLPWSLADFTVDFDIRDVSDGGVFLRAAPAPGTASGIMGILLNLKTPGGGPRIYWHVFLDGNNISPPLNIYSLDYGSSPHVHIEVSGDTYAVFLNGSPTPVTTLTTNVFSSGRVALYDFSSQSFDNFILGLTGPPLSIRLDADAVVVSWKTNSSGFVLETAAELTPGARWSSLSGPYAVAGGEYLFKLPRINFLHQQFFRLRFAGP